MRNIEVSGLSIVMVVVVIMLIFATPSNSDVMAVCQLSHSFDTCHAAMNR